MAARDVTKDRLARQFSNHTDLEAAQRMRRTEQRLFVGFDSQQKKDARGGPWNAGPWMPWKTKGRSPTAPQPLEIAGRFPHSHRLVWAWESGKTKSMFPTFPLAVFALKTKFRKEPWRQSLRSRRQAHSSMRKWWPDKIVRSTTRNDTKGWARHTPSVNQNISESDCFICSLSGGRRPKYLLDRTRGALPFCYISPV